MRTMLLAGLIGIVLSNQAPAQKTMTVSDDAKFVVQLDIEVFRNTKLGKRLLGLTQKMAKQEIGNGDEDILEKVEETLGFNPLEEVRTITAVGASYEHPEEDLRVMVRMGQTTGNLEGLVLAAPGYSSEERDGVTVHSVTQDEMQAYAAIHSDGSGNKTIVAATQREDLMEMLLSLRGGAPSSQKQRQISWQVPEATFLQVQVLEFPKEVYENDPPANIAKMIKDLSMTIAEESDNYAVDLFITTESEKRAEQMQQLVQGAKALAGMFENEIGDDQDAKMLLSLLDTVTVSRDSESVQVHVAIPEDLIIKFLREEADLPL